MEKNIKKIIAATLMMSILLNTHVFAEAPINYNITNNYYGNTAGYNPYSGGQLINQNYYFISGYDRVATIFYNNEPMETRIPVIGGNNYYYVNIANGLTLPAYQSIESYCNANIINGSVQGFFLNYASIESQTQTTITLIINCALKKKGVIDGRIEFRCTLDLQNNRYNWYRIGSHQDRPHYRDRDIYYYP